MEWEAKKLTVSLKYLKNILINLFYKNNLKNGDLNILLWNILEVRNILIKEKIGDLDTFFIKLENCLEGSSELKNFKNFDIFYDTISIFYKNKVILNSIDKIISKLLNLKISLNKEKFEKTKLLFELRESKKNIVDFFTEKFLFTQKDYINNLFDFEMDFYIGKSSDLFFDVIKNIFYSHIKWIIREQNFNSNKIYLTLMRENINNVNEKIEIYKKILNIYSDNNRFNPKDDLWFYEILDQLGEVKSINKKWELFTFEEKRIFKKWFFGKEIYNAFKNVNDPERGEFWKSFAHCIVDFKIYKNISQAIVMEFKNHTVVEFGKIGNAAYVYPKHVLSVSMVNDLFDLYSNTRIVSEKLKDKSKAIPLKISNLKPGWNHPANWQQTFRYKLSELGYR